MLTMNLLFDSSWNAWKIYVYCMYTNIVSWDEFLKICFLSQCIESFPLMKRYRCGPFPLLYKCTVYVCDHLQVVQYTVVDLLQCYTIKSWGTFPLLYKVQLWKFSTTVQCTVVDLFPCSTLYSCVPFHCCTIYSCVPFHCCKVYSCGPFPFLYSVVQYTDVDLFNVV